MRRYELMLVFRPDAPDDRIAAIIDRTTRQITADGGQIVKVAPWGRRRLAYPIDRHREGAYHIVVFEAPTTDHRASWSAASSSPRRSFATWSFARTGPPARPATPHAGGDGDETPLPSAEDEEEEDDGRERIDESESEAAPAAID